MRNNLLTKDICFTASNVQKRAKWSHIKALFDIDVPNADGYRMCRNLAEKHVEPKGFVKMRVKYAA